MVSRLRSFWPWAVAIAVALLVREGNRPLTKTYTARLQADAPDPISSVAREGDPPRSGSLKTKKPASGAVWELLRESYSESGRDHVPRLGASLAYYAIFSVPPLMVILIAVAGLLFGEKMARADVAGRTQAVLGTQGATALQSMIQSASRPARGFFGAAVGGIVLLLGASGMFMEIESALNTIWKVQPSSPKSLWENMKERLPIYAIVLALGFLLLISLLLSAALSALASHSSGVLAAHSFALRAGNFLLSFGVLAVLFATLFKVLPGAQIAWEEVWTGALLTALLFSAGKFIIAVYLSKSLSLSSYRGASAMMLVIVWVYYSAQIFYFGAEFTHAYSRRHGAEQVRRPDTPLVPELKNPVRA